MIVEINAMKSQEVNFQKSQKMLASRAGSSKQTFSPYGVYATRHWNWMNSYWMFWIGNVCGARSASSICDFLKMTFLTWFNHIFLLFAARKSCVFQIFLLRSIKTYLCANIINFDNVDFSGRRPEEVISFFWRSVYICLEVQTAIKMLRTQIVFSTIVNMYSTS